MPFSRIRLVADQFVIALDDDDPGALVWEQGTVQGVSGLVLKAARIKDLSVKTIHLKNESVTVPAGATLVSNFDTTTLNSPVTFAEQNISTRGVAGSLIFVQLFMQVVVGPISGGGTILLRGLLDNAVVAPALAIAGSFGSPGQVEARRVSMTSIPATGSPQTINVKWQVFNSTGAPA